MNFRGWSPIKILEIPGGRGGHQRPPGTENPGGWGGANQNVFRGGGGGGMDIFWNHTMCEGWPHHQGLRPLLFSNSEVGIFTSHKNQISVSAVTYVFFVLIRKDIESNRLQMSLQRQHFLFSYLGPWVLVWLGFEPATSHSAADWCSPSWANQVEGELAFTEEQYS